MPTPSNNQNFEAILPDSPQPEASHPVTPTAASFLTKLRQNRLLALALAIFGVFFIGLVLVALFVNQPPPALVARPTPQPSPTPTPYISQPSIYATDAIILQIEHDLQAINQSLTTVDLKQIELTPPTLDLDVNFTD